MLLTGHTVVYDGDCRVCSRAVAVLRRWDRRQVLEIIPYQDPSVATRFPWIAPAAFAEAMQLIGPGGRTWAGAAAIEQLLTVLPAGWIFGWIFKVPILGRLADRFYRWFARNRSRLGCGDHCPLPIARR